MGLSEKEQLVLERFEKYIVENGCSVEMMVSVLKLTLDYANAGSASHLSKIHNCTPQYVNRTAKKFSVNGINVYSIDG